MAVESANLLLVIEAESRVKTLRLIKGFDCKDIKYEKWLLDFMLHLCKIDTNEVDTVIMHKYL